MWFWFRRLGQRLSDDRGDFIQNAIWIVVIVLAMIPLFNSLKAALTNAFQQIINAIQGL